MTNNDSEIDKFIREVNQEYVNKLKALNIFDMYIEELKKRFGEQLGSLWSSGRCSLVNAKSFHSFIDLSLRWCDTKKGRYFWETISKM